MASSAKSVVALLIACFLVLLAAGDAHGGHQEAETPKGGHDDLVAQACTKVMERYDDDKDDFSSITKEYCVRTLRSDKRSAAATHPRDLALVALDLLQRAAADADAKIASVPKGDAAEERYETAVTVLFSRMDYDSVARTVRLCRPVVEGYRAGDGDHESLSSRYEMCGKRLFDAAVRCQTYVWGSRKVDKVAREEVDEAVNRAYLVQGMIDQMLSDDN